MAEYIKREAAKDELLSWAVCINHPEHLMREDAMHVLDSIPASDVAPVRRGSWNSDETCPFCGKKSTEGLDAEKWDYWFPDFCPHCGAMLNGGEPDA